MPNDETDSCKTVFHLPPVISVIKIFLIPFILYIVLIVFFNDDIKQMIINYVAIVYGLVFVPFPYNKVADFK